VPVATPSPAGGGQPPQRPVIADTERTADGVTLHWVDTSHPQAPATAFAVYRFDGAVAVRACDIADASHLLGAVRTTGDRLQSFVDTTAEPDRRYTYVLTALDRLQNESEPSPSRVVN
jgi:hypothetical protein